MTENSLKTRIQDDMKAALRAHEKERLSTIRLLMAAIQQREIDEQKILDDTLVMATIEKMIKQRRDAIEQFKLASRDDLANKEEAEIIVLQTYLPQPLSESEIDQCIQEAIAGAGATSIRDMGKVMGIIRPKVQGRAEMGSVSAKIKAILSDQQ